MADANIITAICEILKADGEVTALAGRRVFGDELPAREAKAMPRHAIVVHPSGGASMAMGSYLNHDAQRFDLFCYGSTPFEADALRRACRAPLADVRRRVVAGCLIHWIEPAGGFFSARDPDAAWPRTFQSFQVFYALQEV
ncbi:tail completion protein gp17 [Phyllobacterium leguminum]|uniref:Uncharacterized protein DUF3168 n=1 Tax=Phyllobacterium leguminum TaxID=314237 RepID=A0A318T023_9HYPH|nr:DUF3168 domain-containing protein [Phyllobacterium leguminum]PYE86913.1 uncharacterized protein DUF3168 [Phyllobacterium leguminum]